MKILSFADASSGLLLFVGPMLMSFTTTRAQNNGPEGGVMEYINTRDDISTFKDLFDNADTRSVNFAGATLFVPNNAAFDAYFATDFGSKLANDEAYKTHFSEILGGHYVRDALISTENITNGFSSTLRNYDPIRFNVTTKDDGNSVISVNDGTATVVDSDIVLDDAIVHIIDGVLPPTFFSLSLPDAIQTADSGISDDYLLQPAFDTLLGNIADGPFTVFTPDSRIFARYMSSHTIFAERMNSDSEYAEKTRLNHIVDGLIGIDDFKNNAVVTTLAGESFIATMDQDGRPKLVQQGSKFEHSVGSGVAAQNGIFYYTWVLQVADNIEYNYGRDVMADRAELSIMSNYPSFAGEGPLGLFMNTYFPCTDEGWSKFQADDPEGYAKLESPNFKAVRRLLYLYPSVIDSVFSSDYMKNGNAESVKEHSITVGDDGAIMIGDKAKVVTADIETFEPSVLHIVDYPLVPSWFKKSIVDAMIDDPTGHPIFQGMLSNSTKVYSILSDMSRDFTIIGLHEEAFDKLDFLSLTQDEVDQYLLGVTFEGVVDFDVEVTADKNYTVKNLLGAEMVFSRNDEGRLFVNGILLRKFPFNVSRNGIMWRAMDPLIFDATAVEVQVDDSTAADVQVDDSTSSDAQVEEDNTTSNAPTSFVNVATTLLGATGLAMMFL